MFDREQYRKEVGRYGPAVLVDALVREAELRYQYQEACATKEPFLRSVLSAFAVQMETKLRQNDHKTNWKRLAAEELLAMLLEEVGELVKTFGVVVPAARDLYVVTHHLDCAVRVLREWSPFLDPQLSRDTAEEAVDVANFAMMLADISASSGGT